MGQAEKQLFVYVFDDTVNPMFTKIILRGVLLSTLAFFLTNGVWAPLPQALGQTPDQPTVYAEVNFGGAAQTVGTGIFDAAKGELNGVGDNAISSLKIPTGYNVIACRESSYATTRTFGLGGMGLCRYYAPGEAANVALDLDDQVSLLVVGTGPGQGPPIRAYRGIDFGGVTQTFPGNGLYEATKGDLATVGDNTISSLKIPPGYRALVCENDISSAIDLGICRYYGGGEYRWVFDLNDKISLIALYSTNKPAATDTNPGKVGQWSEPMPWPLIAVHAMLNPDGKVLTWDATDDDRTHSWYSGGTDHSTQVDLWDPTTNQHQFVNQTNNGDMFCAGFAHLPDGRAIVVGGNVGLGGAIKKNNVFDPATQSWSKAPEMRQARWYGTLTPLANGHTFAIGGGPVIPEVFTLTGVWRSLTAAARDDFGGFYPWTQVAPNGQVFYAGPGNRLAYIDIASRGTLINQQERDLVYRDYGSYATFSTGKALVAGGAHSAKSALVIDYNSATPIVTVTGRMTYGRRQHLLTVLADGKVLAVGGNDSGEWGIDLAAGIFAPELWDPVTGKWSLMANMHIQRQYHATALLLPDGTLFSAGGGFCCDSWAAPLPLRSPINNFNAEIFSPPYLFNADGTPATRPQIIAAPDQIRFGQNFNIQSTQLESIAKVHLIRLGAVTHATNMEQRLVPLIFTKSTTLLKVTAPANGSLAPPGYYMLFLVNNIGVPSVAKILRVGNVTPSFLTTPTIAAAAPTTLVADAQEQHNAATAFATSPDQKPVYLTASALTANGVWLTWLAPTEKTTIGYRVYRGESTVRSEAMELTPQIIDKAPFDRPYSFLDADMATITPESRYWLEALYADGSLLSVGPVTPGAPNETSEESIDPIQEEMSAAPQVYLPFMSR